MWRGSARCSIRRTCGNARPIYRYNYKRTLCDHDTVQRVFALNDEAALVICDYGKAPRPRIPFPYFAEVMTGFEYSTAAHMIYAGMVREGIECIHNIRSRYDGEKRNPWDEAECGHHYARAMAAWSGLLALSGFQYDAPAGSVVVVPRSAEPKFRCFWSTATAWGTFSVSRLEKGTRLALQVDKGSLACRRCTVRAGEGKTTAALGGRAIAHRVERAGGHAVFELADGLQIKAGDRLELEVRA